MALYNHDVVVTHGGLRQSCHYNSLASLVTKPPPQGYKVHLLHSPLHIQVIWRWQTAPGLLKSHAAHIVSSTMAGGLDRNIFSLSISLSGK